MSEAKRLSAPVAPGGTIGILGGGQLGRMLSLAAARLGMKTHIYSDESDAPAFQVSAAQTSAEYGDRAALEKFAKACDAITFEFENVPAETAAIVAAITPTNPGARALKTAQDRFEEKSFVARQGLATADFEAVDSQEGARIAFETIAAPSVLKTRRMGYDGKGQAKVASADEAARAFAQFKNAPCILERFVTFDYEASVVAARGVDGAFAAYDPPENIHENHILRRSIVPSRLSPQGIEKAVGLARKIADALDYVGVFAVELFVKGDELLVNEIAPQGAQFRPLDDRCLSRQPVRAAHPRRCRLAARRPCPPLWCRDGKHHRRGSRALVCLRRERRRPAPLWQTRDQARPENGPHHKAHAALVRPYSAAISGG